MTGMDVRATGAGAGAGVDSTRTVPQARAAGAAHGAAPVAMTARTAEASGEKALQKNIMRAMRLALFSMHFSSKKPIGALEVETTAYYDSIKAGHDFLPKKPDQMLLVSIGAVYHKLMTPLWMRARPFGLDPAIKIDNVFGSDHLVKMVEIVQSPLSENLKNKALERLLYRVVPSFSQQVYIMNMAPELLALTFQDNIIDIFESIFEAYQGRALPVQFKNSVLALYCFFEYGDQLIKAIKLQLDAWLAALKVHGSLDMPLDWFTPEERLSPVKAAQLKTKISRLNEELCSKLPNADDFMQAQDQGFKAAKSQLLSQPYMQTLFAYAQAYLALHAGDLNAAFEDDTIFPTALDLASLCQEGFDSAALEEAELGALEIEKSNSSRYLSGNAAGCYQNFLHIYLKIHIDKVYAALQSEQSNDQATPSMRALREKILDLLEPLSELDFKLSVFDHAKAQAMFKALDQLHGLINDLKRKEKVQADLAARRAKPKGKMTAKAKAAARKRAQAKRASPKISSPAIVQSDPKAVKLDPDTTQQLSAVEKVVTIYVDEQKTYLATVEAFLIGRTKNSDHAILQALFDPKSKFKSILDLKEMKSIATHLQEALFPAQTHKAWDVLGGANGVKFRVGNVINTVHNSSAEKGHKGHGGCVDGYRDFLIRIYEQEQVVAT